VFALLAEHFCFHTMPAAWRIVKTDFPDYYLPAVLAHQHFDMSRVYEWLWLERQKDHRDIGVQIINLVPSTAFSALFLYPLASLPVLVAKHCWLIFNLGLVVATVCLLRGITQISWRRIALITALSYPLRGNFLTGQYYVLLLFLLTLACYLYLRQTRFLAGVVIGLAAGLKIFPVVYLLYFLRKRDLRALAGGVVGGIGAAVASVLAFGWEMNRVYLLQVLPWTLRGEVMAPYTLKNPSLASLLHRLFIYEPQLNPHPAIHAAWLFAVLHPLIQMAVMAPALLLAIPGKTGSQPECLRRVRLEWAAILLASLAISTTPQYYHFTLLILPACIVLEALQREKAYLSYAILLPLYLVTGYATGTEHVGEGWGALLGAPRPYLLLVSCVLMSVLLIRQQRYGGQPVPEQLAKSWKRDRLAWAVGLTVILAFSISGNFRHLRGIEDDYQWRISTPKEAYMVVHPAVQGDDVLLVAMVDDGYHSGTVLNGMTQGGITQFNSTGPDQLAVTAANGETFVEQARHESKIVSTLAGRSDIPQAEFPVASFDGHWLAFLREDKGRARIWVHSLAGTETADRPVTPAELNALEMSFLPNGDLIFAAISNGRPGLFAATGIQGQNESGSIRSLSAEEARYPAVSPDGHWLAYSRLQGGNFNLWLRDLTNGQTQRLTHAECNATEPAWDGDSKNLVYASDCGRGLWFSALCRRRVIP
jgi:Glycosyltransferase family 87/WD40-like Beta Propeller Repeat